MVHDRIAAGETTVVSTAAVLRCGKQMEQLPHYNFSWTVSLQKICEIFRLEISSRSHSLDISVWKRLWTCRETDKKKSKAVIYTPTQHTNITHTHTNITFLYQNIRRNLRGTHTHWHTSTRISKRGTSTKEEKGNNTYI
jgi:hypothetical protein